MSATSKPSRRIDTSPQVTRWRAEQARRAARTGTDPGRGRRYGWPTDRHAIITATLVAAPGRERGPGTRNRAPAAADER